MATWSKECYFHGVSTPAAVREKFELLGTPDGRWMVWVLPMTKPILFMSLCWQGEVLHYELLHHGVEDREVIVSLTPSGRRFRGVEGLVHMGVRAYINNFFMFY